MAAITPRQYDEIYILDDFYDISRRIVRCGEKTNVSITPRYEHRNWNYLLSQGCLFIHI